jgi:hypothetical protein
LFETVLSVLLSWFGQFIGISTSEQIALCSVQITLGISIVASRVLLSKHLLYRPHDSVFEQRMRLAVSGALLFCWGLAGIQQGFLWGALIGGIIIIGTTILCYQGHTLFTLLGLMFVGNAMVLALKAVSFDLLLMPFSPLQTGFWIVLLLRNLVIVTIARLLNSYFIEQTACEDDTYLQASIVATEEVSYDGIASNSDYWIGKEER